MAGKNGGARPGAGRKKLWDQAEILDRVKGIQRRWWQEIEGFLDSKDKNDRKFALTEINKLQTKALPQALTGEGGGPVQFQWLSPSRTNPEGGQNSSTPARNRWLVLVLHRRAGKTTAVLNHLQRDCLRIPESQFAYIGPTYKQSKRVAWDIAKKISRDIPGVSYNESELTVRYPNGSKLLLVGSDNPDSLRGIALWGVGFDEYSQQPSNIFSEIISKALADHLGYAIFFGTPKGKNEFHRIYQAAKDDPEWTVVLRTIDDSLRDETGQTIDNLRQALVDDRRLVEQGLMTEDEFQQEWYCSFDAAIKGAYYAIQLAAARAAGRIKTVPYDPALKVHTVWDLGIGQHLGIGFYQRIGQEVHMIDYWEGENKEGIPSAIKALQNKPYVYGKHFLPHDAQGTEQATEQSRLATAQKLWPTAQWELIPRLQVDDRINKGKLMFAREWFDEKNCQTFLDYLAQYRQEWDENRGMFLEKPYHDFTSHAADVHGYAALVEDQMTNSEPKKYKQQPVESDSLYYQAA